MSLSEVAILDPSTAFGLVAGWLLQVYPAGGSPLLEASMLAQIGALFWALQLLASAALKVFPSLSAPFGRICGTAAAVSAIWVAALLGLDAYLAALSLPRLSPQALTPVPALMGGVVAVHAGIMILVELGHNLIGWGRRVLKTLKGATS